MPSSKDSKGPSPSALPTKLSFSINFTRNLRVYDICQSIMTLAIGQLLWMMREQQAVKLLLVAALEVIITTAAITQPRWWRRGGRVLLLVVIRPLTLALLLFELLLAPPHPILPATTRLFYLGSKGVLLLFFGMLCQVQAQLNLRMACTSWLLLLLCNTAISWAGGQPLQDINTAVSMIHLFVGACCPALLVSLHGRRMLGTQHQSGEAQSANHASADSQAASAREQQDTERQFCASQPGWQACEAPPSPQPCTTKPIPQASEALGKTGLRRSIYKPRVHAGCPSSHISIKIQHHGAFDDRLAIVDAVRLRLCACLADSSGGGAPAIACVAIPGCLQVIMSVTDPWAGAAGMRLASEPQSMVQEIYDSLPADYRAGQVMVQVGAAACRFAPEGDTQPGQGEQATSVGAQMVTIQSLLVHPACGLQSGLSEEQEAEVQLQGSCASTGLKVVAVACAGGRQVHVEAIMAPAETSCRLILPAGLDAGPVTVHALSTQPGGEGLLLASCCTMALPPPATQELLELLQHCADDGGVGGDDSGVHAEVGMVLEDLGNWWALSSHAGVGAGAPVEIQEYFTANELNSCLAALEAWLQGTQLVVPGCAEVPPDAQLLAANARRSYLDYGSWGQFQSPRASLVAATLFIAVVSFAWLNMQRYLDGATRLDVAANVVIALHLMLVIAPHLMVVLGGTAVHVRRSAVMLLQAAGKSMLHLITLWWPALAAQWLSAEFGVQMLLIEGILRPAMNQVPWRVQLLMSLCEEGAKIASCWSSSRPGGSDTCKPSPWAFHAALVAIACTVSYLVQRFSVANILRSRCRRAAAAAGGSQSKLA